MLEATQQEVEGQRGEEHLPGVEAQFLAVVDGIDGDGQHASCNQAFVPPIQRTTEEIRGWNEQGPCQGRRHAKPELGSGQELRKVCYQVCQGGVGVDDSAYWLRRPCGSPGLIVPETLCAELTNT